MVSQGYVRFPTIYRDQIIFVSEDDLWLVSSEGGRAERLTAGVGEVKYPRFSPDGQQLAFVGSEEGPNEVYVMPALGGSAQRLTFHASSRCRVLGWTPSGEEILYASNAGQFTARFEAIHAIKPSGGMSRPLPYGLANAISYHPSGGIVLGRNINTREFSHWKRYRGGTTGHLWCDLHGDGNFQRLLQLQGNIADPCWVGDRLYFLSDHDGIGNLYSCTPQGEDLRQHTFHREFYARHLSTDGQRLVYHSAADLYLFDPQTENARNYPAELATPTFKERTFGDSLVRTSAFARPQEEAGWATNARHLEVSLPSTRTQRVRKFVSASAFLDSYALHPQGHSVAITTRGKAFSMSNWEGPVLQYGEPDGVRYRFLEWLNNGKWLVAINDASGHEELIVFHSEIPDEPTTLFPDIEFGRAVDFAVSPTDNKVAITNHRNELILADLDPGTARVLDRSEAGRIHGIAWSPDGRWLAYGFALSAIKTAIKLCNIETGETHQITEPILHDIRPSFDPAGKYLYFLGYRIFAPTYDHMHFDLGFPRGVKPYVILLRKDLRSPFIAQPKGMEIDEEDKDEEDEPEPEEEKKKDEQNGEKGTENGSAEEKHDEAKDESLEKEGEAKDESSEKEGEAKEEAPKENGNGKEKKKPNKKKPKPIVIDLEGIQERVLPFPVAEGRFSAVRGVKGRAFFLSLASETMSDEDLLLHDARGSIDYYDLDTYKLEHMVDGVSGFDLSRDCKHLIYRQSHRLRVVKSVEKSIKLDSGERPGRESGWLDLSRLKVSVQPAAEWKQMFAEAWRLQREHFWDEDMLGIDWDAIYAQYAPLVERVSSRSELSDLLWELHGELGTSHAFEWGGEYRQGPYYRQGFLGIDWCYNNEEDRYRIAKIVKGDPSDRYATSPLTGPGLAVSAGDAILAINGQRVGPQRDPQELLVNQAGNEVQLLIEDAPNGKTRTIIVKALGNEMPARYRDWVEHNRRFVHEQSHNRVGYIHIPDMGKNGYAEFHRSYLAEYDHEALLVDVRWNAGGHVSGLLLEKLARRRIGYDFSRWFPPKAYPEESPRGPMVALTNEHAGSDGDVFCHSFKLMGLGPLIGKRTWGGVVGISPSHKLVDGTTTTQPEYSFWFKDAGWNIENHGADPDIEIDIAPQDYAEQADPQLARALAEALHLLETYPNPDPKPSTRPHLARKTDS